MLEEVPPFEGAFWRYFLASITLLLLCFKKLPTINIIKRNLLGILLIGGIGLFGFNFFFFKGMEITTPINAALIIGLNPAITLIFSRLILKTPISVKQIAGMVLACIGVVYLLFEGNISLLKNFKLNLGDGVIMLSSIFFALHHVWVKKYSNPSISNAQLSLLSAIVCLTMFTFVLPLGNDLSEVFQVTKYSTKFWQSALGIGCLGTGVAYWFWYKGIDISNAAKAAVFINIVPLSSAIFYVIFGSELKAHHIISGMIIISGILVMQLKKPLKNI